MNYKENILSIVLGLVAFIAVGIIICEKIAEVRQNRQDRLAREVQQQKTDQLIKQFAVKHNAIMGWEKSFEKKEFSENILTLEVQRAFVFEDDRPVLFVSNVADIVKDEDVYIVYFKDSLNQLLGLNFGFNIDFNIRCTSAQVDKISSCLDSNLNEFAVVARISRVTKEAPPEDELFAGNSNMFTGEGTCLDLICLDE